MTLALSQLLPFAAVPGLVCFGFPLIVFSATVDHMLGIRLLAGPVTLFVAPPLALAMVWACRGLRLGAHPVGDVLRGDLGHGAGVVAARFVRAQSAVGVDA